MTRTNTQRLITEHFAIHTTFYVVCVCDALFPQPRRAKKLGQDVIGVTDQGKTAGDEGGKAGKLAEAGGHNIVWLFSDTEILTYRNHEVKPDSEAGCKRAYENRALVREIIRRLDLAEVGTGPEAEPGQGLGSTTHVSGRGAT